MHGFTMALAQELASKGVTVNTVSPGYIGTDMVRAIEPEVLEKIVATIPVKRLGTPRRSASSSAWLAGDDSGFTTGADFSCNGGHAAWADVLPARPLEGRARVRLKPSDWRTPRAAASSAAGPGPSTTPPACSLGEAREVAAR
jgi:hypothetical protein